MKTLFTALLMTTALGLPLGDLSAETAATPEQALDAWRTEVGAEILAAGDAALGAMKAEVTGPSWDTRSNEFRRLSATLVAPARHPAAIEQTRRLAAE